MDSASGSNPQQFVSTLHVATLSNNKRQLCRNQLVLRNQPHDVGRSNPDAQRITSRTVLQSQFSLHPEVVVGTGQYTEIGKTGGVIVVRHKTTNQLYIAKPVKNTPHTQTEIDILLAIQSDDHPNIANCVDIIDQDGPDKQEVSHYIVMNDGGCNLRTLMGSPESPRGLDRTVIEKIIPQLIEALFFLYGNGIIHGDVKPDNLLINEEGLLQLCDFGLSRFIGERVPDGQNIPVWNMPPEIASCPYSNKIDMWSAGCTLAELITGRDFLSTEMIKHRQLGDIKWSIQKAANDIESCLGGAARKFFLAMMKIDPAERLTPETAREHPYIKGLRKKAQSIGIIQVPKRHLTVTSEPHQACSMVTTPSTPDRDQAVSYTSIMFPKE